MAVSEAVVDEFQMFPRCTLQWTRLVDLDRTISLTTSTVRGVLEPDLCD